MQAAAVLLNLVRYYMGDMMYRFIQFTDQKIAADRLVRIWLGKGIGATLEPAGHPENRIRGSYWLKRLGENQTSNKDYKL